jgi:coenzyme F420 hydrogenase subunit beta
MKHNSIASVSHKHACTGCGGCSYQAPERIKMVDIDNYGIRPMGRNLASEDASYCGGAYLDRTRLVNTDNIQSLFRRWGPVLDVYEGFASDERIRLSGSSGGVLTALSDFAVESGIADAVLSTGAAYSDPLTNISTFSEKRSELIDKASSRYLVSSPLSALNSAVDYSKVAVVGKPCDAATLSNLRVENTDLDEKVSLSLSFFCAGTPSKSGNLSYIQSKLGFAPALINSLKFRGDGWPGLWKVVATKNEQEVSAEATYSESWGNLQQYRQWRCFICPDHSGEYSDISCGDAWYKKPDGINPGSSLIVVRTKRGQEFLQRAIDEGVITIIQKDSSLIDSCQPNLISARNVLFGRLLAMRILFMPVPEFKGYELFRSWLDLSFKTQVVSVLGTLKRLVKKKLYLPERRE